MKVKAMRVKVQVKVAKVSKVKVSTMQVSRVKAKAMELKVMQLSKDGFRDGSRQADARHAQDSPSQPNIELFLEPECSGIFFYMA